ncbi:hypothetical protein SAMN05444920_117125 [Nonomuraea solani]|uniref:Lantibiotic dehydratase, C terminus n=1 Tax=Nonomuraea solani TaxID=1144553 RepID=A0A1H6EVH6_9ACTN|nr:lantibiotic dehydratase [Nonomuraea solani]SEH00694.1 hypothetical protein SAMN05444920_117125 [Nonomuraea solani]
MIEHDWTLLPTVVVRSAGFPWELVLSLAYPRAAETAATVVRLERQALDLLADAPAHGATSDDARRAGSPTGSAGSGRLSRGLRSRLRDLRPLPAGAPGPDDWLVAWNKATGLLEEARLTLTGLAAGDAALVRAAVSGVVTDERFLDALVCSAPGLYRELRRGAKGGRTRRELAGHLQELSAKCGTSGCFGPINYATIEPGRASGYTWEGHRACPRRVAFPAARVGEALQQRILADSGLVARLVPRRKTWAGDVLDGAAFVAWCDGDRTLAEIAAESGTGLERASAALAVAVRRGLLTHDLCPPATIPDTLGWLLERLTAAGVPMTRPGPGSPGREGRKPPSLSCECGFPHGSDGHSARRGPHTDVPPQGRRALAGRPPTDADLPLGRRVGEIAELLGQYPTASPDVKLAVQRRIEALAGGGRRDDRVIVHEAAAGTLRVTAGEGLAADLERRVPRVLDLLAGEAELTRVRTNRLLAARLGAGTFELSEALRATGDLEVQHDDRLAARIAAIVRDAPAGATVLNLAGLLDEPAAPAAPVLCTADVMVAAPSLEAYEPGRTPLVLGDLHDGVLLTPWALQFHEESAACLAERDTEIRRALSGFTALNVIARRTNGLPPLELPGPVLELGGVAADPMRRRIGLDELYVHSDGRRAVLHAKGMDEPLMFHNGEHDTALHTALALPRLRRIRLGDLPRVPRLTWDNVVISRRRWRVGRTSFDALGQAAGDRELLVAMARLRETHDLPPTFFAASPRERRPIYVDTRSPALIEGLGRLAGTADRLTVTEVLPGPEDCWLREKEQRFPAELRCVYLRPARSVRHDPRPSHRHRPAAAPAGPAAPQRRRDGAVARLGGSGEGPDDSIGRPGGSRPAGGEWFGPEPPGLRVTAQPREQSVSEGRAHPYPWPGEGG